MIIADTNVWSEPLKKNPDRRVLNWFKTHSAKCLLTVVTVQELHCGLEIMKQTGGPDNKRALELENRINELTTNMAQKVLNYDSEAARQHALVRAKLQSQGRHLSAEDGQIVGIALANGFKIATRNVKDFEGTRVNLINPWVT